MNGMTSMRNALSARCLHAVLCLLALSPAALQAADDGAVCARVKIEIRQELTMERQGFDAEMVIQNGLTDEALSQVDVDVTVTDELGAPVLVSSDPSSTTAKFFIRVSQMSGIADVAGAGTVSAGGSATINWLLIPAPGAAGTLPTGKKYLVGATLKYRVAGESEVVTVSPDLITVRPMPLLTLDYFLTKEVLGDDPFTAPIEPPVPFTLAVRVKNTGMATAKALKIDSAQPKILENQQGLLVNFRLLDSAVEDLPVQNSLLATFGDIGGGLAKSARWNMEASLSGQFTEFNVRFSHAAELGGQLTSLMQATRAHFLVHDVQVDLPGRDYVRDFLAQDDDQLRVYESSGVDTPVVDASAQATLAATSGDNYRLDLPATTGFFYVKKPDPHAGQKAVGTVLRSDGKTMPLENVWLSKTQDPVSHQWSYWVNLFDADSTGIYDTAFVEPPLGEQPPVIGLVIDRSVYAGNTISFVVEASSPSGAPVTLQAAPLPAGATFTPQAIDPQAPTLARAIFAWTPTAEQIGTHNIIYSASDGARLSTRTAAVIVDPVLPPPGPQAPTLESPPHTGEVNELSPVLAVLTSTEPLDTTAQVVFELYADSAMSALVATGTVDKAASGPTSFTPPDDLQDNARYWWRARSFDGTSIYSDWIDGAFFVNLANDAPESFSLSSPDDGLEVTVLQPVLSWSNTTDVDGDALHYAIYLYGDAAGTQGVASATELAPDTASTVTTWPVPVELVNHATYYWKVLATDEHGTSTPTPLRAFTVNTGNVAPTTPMPVAPAVNAWIYTDTVPLVINNAQDTDGDLLTYLFELDTVSTFDSGFKQSSGLVLEGVGGTTSWTTGTLADNQHYYWRTKAQDGRAESPWLVSEFGVNIGNQLPPVPTLRNPSNDSYTTSQSPVLTVYAVTDPDADPVTYEFEIYKSSEPTTLVASGVSTGTSKSWTVPVMLDNYTRYEWRARAKDPYDGNSAWSELNQVNVTTDGAGTTTLAFTAPLKPVVPVEDSGRRYVDMAWTVANPYQEQDVDLYWSTERGVYTGTWIGTAHFVAGSAEGSFRWDVTEMSSGTYYLYGVAVAGKTQRKAFTAGALVIPASPQLGTFTLTEPSTTTLNEWSAPTTAPFTLALGVQPTKKVVVRVTSTDTTEGTPASATRTWQPDTWTNVLTQTARASEDCIVDGDHSWDMVFEPVESEDPNYIGLVIPPRTFTTKDAGDVENGRTDSVEISLCGARLTRTTFSDTPLVYEWTLTMAVTNSGASVTAVTAQAAQNLPAGWTFVDDSLGWGAIGTNGTLKSTDASATTAVFHNSTANATTVRNAVNNIIWTITTEP